MFKAKCKQFFSNSLPCLSLHHCCLFIHRPYWTNYETGGYCLIMKFTGKVTYVRHGVLTLSCIRQGVWELIHSSCKRCTLHSGYTRKTQSVRSRYTWNGAGIPFTLSMSAPIHSLIILYLIRLNYAWRVKCLSSRHHICWSIYFLTSKRIVSATWLAC